MPEATQKPPVGEQSGDQMRSLGAMALGVGTPHLFGGGGTLDNPMGWDRWHTAGFFYGTYATYRRILSHPTVRLARATAVSPLLASTWYYEADPGAPKEAVETITRTFDRLRRRYVADAVRALDFGHAAFEPVWRVDDGKWVVERIKPLLVDTTAILHDGKGNLAGLRPGSMVYGPTGGWVVGEGGDRRFQDGDLRADRLKALLFSHDAEAGNLYGRSRLENVRDTAWKQWLNYYQQLLAIGGKLSGRSAVIKCPVGTYTDPKTNATRSHQDDALLAAEAFKAGQVVILTNLSLSADDPELMAKLAGTALVTFDVIDFGEITPAVSGLLAALRHEEELIFNGLLRSARTALESTNGSRADAEQHTDTGITDSQLVGDEIADSVRPLVDGMARLNWGLKPGSVRVRQSPLQDHRRTTYGELFKELITDPEIRKTAARVIDLDKVIDGQDVPRDGDWDKAEQEVKAEGEEAAKQQMEHQVALKGAEPKPGDGGAGEKPAGEKDDAKEAA